MNFNSLLLTLCLIYSSTSVVVSVRFSRQFAEKDFMVTSTTLPTFDAKRVKRSAHGCEELVVQLHQKDKNLILCLFRESILSYGFLDEETTYVEDVGRLSGVYSSEPVHNLDYVRVRGYALGQRNTSKVDGYLLHNKLLGRVFLNDEVFYIDELITYLPGVMESNHSIVFKVNNASDMLNPYEFIRSKRDLASDTAYYEGKEVHVGVHVDTAWYIIVSKYCKKRSLFGVVHMIHIMNSIYRSQDFFGSGHPSNIGFYVKTLRLVKNNYKLNIGPYFPHRLKDGAVLQTFLSLDWVTKDKTVDMHMLFTGQEVMQGVNGFSPLGRAGITKGGLCAETNNGMYISNLYLNYYAEGGSTQHNLDAATAHEMGHSFGTGHDPPDDSDDEEKKQCKYYIMSPKTDKTANFTKGFTFSECSLKMILPVLADPVRRKCFHHPPPNRQPFCGNHVVDEGEECDCGSKYYCIGTEDCCNTYDSNTGPPCTYRVDQSDCKPPDGLCCTRNCHFRNLSHVDLSCGPHCSDGCPCTNTKQHNIISTASAEDDDTSSCPCGIDGECVADECNSRECTRLGLEECMCPTISTSGCRTCCKLPLDDGDLDECVEADIATEYMLNNGALSRDALEKSAVTSKEIKTATYKKFCKDDECVWLMFRQFPHGEYCLWQGHVGKCTVHGICLVENQMLHRQKRKLNLI